MSHSDDLDLAESFWGEINRIIPRSLSGDGPKEGYPNPWVEVPILTHLAGHLGPEGADSRNAINVLSAHRIIALPGGYRPAVACLATASAAFRAASGSPR
jgi:hypothetical protein